MSELRRNGGPDDGDTAADAASNTDNPTRHPNPEIRSADQNADWPVDRRKVITTQRHFINIEKESADSPVAGKPVTTLSVDWKTGDSADQKTPPPDWRATKRKDQAPDRDRNFVAPEADHPSPADLDAHTLEHAEDYHPGERFSELNVRKRRGDRVERELAEKADDVTEHVGDVFKTFEDLADSRPGPGHAEQKCQEVPQHLTQPYASHNAGDIAMAIAAGGLVLSTLGRRMHDRLNDRRGQRGSDG